MPLVSKPVLYNFDPAFEQQVVTLICARPRFWGRVGQELDPELFRSEPAKLAMRAARSIFDEAGHGPGSPALVIQRLRRWMADGKCSLEAIKKVAEVFDSAEDAGLLDDDEVIAELTPMLQERMRKDAVKIAIESYGKKGDLSKAVALEEKALRIGLPDVLHDDGPGWPEPLGEAAYHGLLGEIVRRVEPHSEADPAAVLVQTLVAFGSAVGPGPHFMAEATPHSTNMFAVVVGQSSRARKGTSWGHVRRFLSDADPIWAGACISSGLRSGEGLAQRFMPRRKQGKTADVVAEGSEPEDEEDGLPDRRCLVVEDELGTLLRSLQRDGNTLSPMLRQAWQGGDLETMTKVTPIKVTGVHVSVIGHITQAELKQLLATTDALNGFANRFLWVCAKRSKHLPERGPSREGTLHDPAPDLG